MDEPAPPTSPRPAFARRAALGRADLLRLFAAEGAEALALFAAELNFERRPKQPPPKAPDTQSQAAPEAVLAAEPPPLSIERPARLPAASFFYVRRREGDPATPADDARAPEWFAEARIRTDDPRPEPAHANPPRRLPLSPWPRLWPALRLILGWRLPTRQPDVPKLVRRLARGEPLKRLPLRQRHGWSPRICLLIDYHARARPYWDDYNALRDALESLHGALGLDVRILVEDPGVAPRFRRPGEHDWRPWRVPAQGVPLLILSDLGMVDGNRERRLGWERFGARLRAAGVAATVLAPVPAQALDPALQRFFALLEWDRASRLRPAPIRLESGPAPAADMLETLLTLLSPAQFVEPDLLRTLRCLLPAGEAHVGLETALWHHAESATDDLAFRFARSDIAESYRARFPALDPGLQQAALARILAHHAHLPESIRLPECNTFRRLAPQLLDADLATRAAQWEKDLAKTCHALGEWPALTQWLARFDARQGPEARRGNAPLAALWVLARREQLARGEPLDLPPEVPREEVAFLLHALTQGEPLDCFLRQRGPELELAPLAGIGQSQAVSTGSPLARLRLSDRTLWVETLDDCGVSGERVLQVTELPQPLLRLSRTTRQVRLRAGAQTLEIEAMPRPAWARAMGRDGEGLFAEVLWLGVSRRLTWQPPDGSGEGVWVADGPLGVDGSGLFADPEIEGVRQRFRWIAPGTFWMGSPENEAERQDDEIRHRVTLSRGYWLAETACTQALWQAVMGDNPSEFKDDPRNPVEQVSWDDVQRFIEKLDGRVAGLGARLPTEAEWEYACRAGTETPFSFGENITPEQVNYFGDAPYAGGKKGITRGRTVPVGTLPANQWGLYEMHGNVWEWCADWYGDYGKGDQVDPQGPPTGDRRVMRGGSWAYGGGRCRCAYRGRYGPGNRYRDQGFRLALGQGASPGGQPAGEERPAGQPRGKRGGQDGRGPAKERKAKTR